MASSAPSDGGGGGDGGDKPRESAPVNLTSLDPPADPQRNSESPAPPSAPVPPSGDDDMSAIGMPEIPDQAGAGCGAKWPLPLRLAPCRACERRKMILRGFYPGPRSDDELSALPSASPPSPVPVTGMGFPDAGPLGTNGTGRCGLCEFRRKIHLDRRRLRRNSEVSAPPPDPFMSIPLLGDDKSRLALEQTERRARRGKKRPLLVEQERGYLECDVGKKLMRHKWDGLRDKWAGMEIHRNLALEMPDSCVEARRRDLLEKIMLKRDSALEMPGFGAAAGRRGLLEKMLLLQDSALEVPGSDAAAGGRGFHEKMILDAQKALRADYANLAWPQGAQKPGFGAAAGVRDMLEKLQLHQDSALAVPGFGAAAGGRNLLEKMMPHRDSALEVPGFGAVAGGRSPLEKMMLNWDSALEVPGIGTTTGGRGLLEKMMPNLDSALEVRSFDASAGGPGYHEKMILDAQKALCADYAKLARPQGAQKASSNAAARLDVLHEKLAQMTKVLTKVLHEGGVLQVSTKLMRLLCPDVGSSVAPGGGLDGSDWRLVEKAIDNLLNQTGEGRQDIAKTVIQKVFSKEILYDLIMACVGRYPKFLDDGKGKLTKEKYEQYQEQLDLMVNLTTVYENDPENFSNIMKLMCKIGRCGPLPSEVIDDISPGLDPTNMEQLYTGMLEMLHNVDRRSPVHTNPFSK